MGTGMSGGKKYLMILGAGVGYFAMTLRPLPAGRASLYVATLAMFFSVSGTLYWMMKDFTGILALSMALNGHSTSKRNRTSSAHV